MTSRCFMCEECGRIARAMQRAWRTDNERVRSKMQSVATASGRDIGQMRIGWVRSIASMPEDQMRALLDSHDPEFADIKRRRAEHECATGHRVRLHGSWALSANEDADLDRF